MEQIFCDISAVLGAQTPQKAAEMLKASVREMFSEYPVPVPDEKELLELSGSVNEGRLKNNPVIPGSNDFRVLYEKILGSFQD